MKKASYLLLPRLRRLPLLPGSGAERASNLLHPPEVKPGAEEDDGEVEDAKGPKDAVVQPFVAVVDVEPGRVFVAVGVLAELAEAVAAVLDVAAGLGDESGRVGLACLTRWRCKSSELVGRANDGAAMGGD